MPHAFEAALDAIARAESPAPPPSRAFPSPPLDFAAPEAGACALWEFAAAWTPEADAPPAPPPPPSARADDIARELDLERLGTAAEVAGARRRFMWANHPDRRRDLDASLANARVAIANMLLDAALARLTARRER